MIRDGAPALLAAALDAAGTPEVARVHWEKLSTMAARYRDQATAEKARARLGSQ